MKEENKYYIPQIEEFCVGFQFESRAAGYDAEWIEETIYAMFRDGWKSNIEDVLAMYEDGGDEFRVKYLSAEDIVELGFIKSVIYDNDFYHLLTDIPTRKGNIDKIMYVLYKEIDNKYSILKGYYLEGLPLPCADIIMFHGEIKNKRELKTILKMIGAL